MADLEPPNRSPDEILVSRTALHELELELIEDRKRIDRHLRLIALLRGGPREKPVTQPLISPTGRKSKCVELSRAMNRQRAKDK
ncbi:MAG: hypothetical protein AB9873_17765 [Syntrophobacteraceae bacterium]